MPSPFYGNTARYNLRKLLGTSNVADIDAGIAALADDIDGMMVAYSEGLLSARPAASVNGRIYHQTDSPFLYYLDTGSAWLTIPLQGAWTALTLTPTIIATSGAYTPSVRAEGDIVRLKGSLASNGLILSNLTVATIPTAAMRPGMTIRRAVVTVGSAAPANVVINTSGQLSLDVAWSAADIVCLDGLTYALS